MALNAFVFGHGLQNRVQCTRSKIFMGGDRYSLVKWSFGFKNHVASDLVNNPIVPIAAKKPD